MKKFNCEIEINGTKHLLGSFKNERNSIKLLEFVKNYLKDFGNVYTLSYIKSGMFQQEINFNFSDGEDIY